MSASLIQPAQWQGKPKTDEQLLIDELGEEPARQAADICDGLASETKGLEEIAARVTGRPGKAAACLFYRWRVRSAALSRIYARACECRAHVLAHSVWDEISAEGDANKAKVKLDALKWLAAKFNRAQFGDDPLTIQGPDGGAVQVEHVHHAATLEDIALRLAKRRQTLELEAAEESEAGGMGVGVRLKRDGGDSSNPPLTLPSPTQGPAPSRVADDAEEA